MPRTRAKYARGSINTASEALVSSYEKGEFDWTVLDPLASLPWLRPSTTYLLKADRAICNARRDEREIKIRCGLRPWRVTSTLFCQERKATCEDQLTTYRE